MVALSALVSDLDAELRRLGYKDSTMVWYRGCWRRIADQTGHKFPANGLDTAPLLQG